MLLREENRRYSFALPFAKSPGHTKLTPFSAVKV